MDAIKFFITPKSAASYRPVEAQGFHWSCWIDLLDAVEGTLNEIQDHSY